MKPSTLVLMAILAAAVLVKLGFGVTTANAVKRHTLTEPDLPLSLGDWTGELLEVSDRQRVYQYSRADGHTVEVMFSSVVIWQRPCFINAGMEIIEEKDNVPLSLGDERTLQASTMLVRGGPGAGTQSVVYWSLDPKGRATGGPVGYVYAYLQRLAERRSKPVFVRFLATSQRAAIADAHEAQLEFIRLVHPYFGA
jgi:hypothetical protein